MLNKVLAETPNNENLHGDLGRAAGHLGLLEESRRNHDAAEKLLGQAVASLKRSVKFNPKHPTNGKDLEAFEAEFMRIRSRQPGGTIPKPGDNGRQL